MRTNGTPNESAVIASSHRQKKTWLTIVTVLAALIVFGTITALTMPASTMSVSDIATPETAAAETTEEPETPAAEAAAEETPVLLATPETAQGIAAEQAATEAASLPQSAQIPEGYTVQRTVRDEENGFAVTVYAPEGVIPEDATLSATLLDQDDEAYQQAGQALAEEANGGDYGFAALDIHFVDADGNEVEPNGDVFVTIDAIGLLPEDADPASVTVQHHEESDDTVTVKPVADTADETEGVVEVTPAEEAETNGTNTLQAAFEVDRFSTFTISWQLSNYNSQSVQVYYVDQDGNQINGSQTGKVTFQANKWVDLDSYAKEIEGYTYTGAHLNSYNGTEARWVTYQSGGSNHWRYSNADSESEIHQNGSQWPSAYGGNRSIYLVYSEPVKVYVYVAATGLSDECLDLLGIDPNTRDKNGYFPAGEIYLDPSYFNGKSDYAVNTPGQALINSETDWKTLLAALSGMDTSNLANKTDQSVWGYNYDKIDYTGNQNNKVGQYLSQARGDVGYTWGSQHTTLFRWHDNPYSLANVHCGFVDQEVDYHLDLFFTTNTINFVLGENGITRQQDSNAYDGLEVDERTYITGSAIQPPEGLQIPDGYYFDGYYEDKDFNRPWNGIGTALTQDETVYIKLSRHPVLALTITKEVAGTSVTGEEYTFTIATPSNDVAGETYTTSVSGTTVTFSNSQSNNYYTATVTMTGVNSHNGVDGSFIIYGLPTGTTYTVTEDADSAAISGYAVTTTYETNGETGNTVTTGSGGSATTQATVAVTNTYSQDTVSLTIVKNIYGLKPQQVINLVNGEYSDEGKSGLRFDVGYFSDQDGAAKDDEQSIKGDWTFDTSETLSKSQNPLTGDYVWNENEMWAGDINEAGVDQSQPNADQTSHYGDSSLTLKKDGDGDLCYQYTITISGLDPEHWYHVWEQHCDVNGYQLVSSVDTARNDGEKVESIAESDHNGKATAFRLTEDTTVTFTNRYTASLNFQKVDETNPNTALSDAQFVIYYETTDADNKVTRHYYKADGTWDATSTMDAAEFTSDSDGIIKITGLENDKTYYLVETVAPNGYQLLENAITITWKADGSASVMNGAAPITSTPVTLNSGEESKETLNCFRIKNSTGAELPETGGAGTTFLTFGGLLMMVAAAGGYELRRRRGKGAR